MAKVSIIVPIYNVEKYLPKCLDSLINQTFKDIEIWAISDGSPDNSVSIIKEYTSKDSRVKCIEKENGGYGSVLEYAIQNITTEYFLICDPDDWLAENAIETLYNLATKNNVDLVVGAKNLVYSDNDEIVYNDSKIKNINLEISNETVYTLDNNELGKALFLTPSPHSKLYKTELAKNIKFPYHVSFTDFLLYTVYVNNCTSFIYTDKALSYYLVDRPGNTMTDTKPKVFDYHATVFKNTMEQVQNSKVKYMYSHMIDHLRFIMCELKKVNNQEIKKEKSAIIYKLLELCMPYKKQINAESVIFSKKIAKYNSLLLNRLTSKTFYNRFVK